MADLREGDLQFAFGSAWRAEKLDQQGVPLPDGMSFVDFVVESSSEIVLLEIKDPAASPSKEEKRRFATEMQGKQLVNGHLVPKARDSYTFLHLMGRDGKSMRFVLVLGTDGMSLQEPLLMALNERLRQRLRQEASDPWEREYMKSSAVVRYEKLSDALPGCSASRVTK